MKRSALLFKRQRRTPYETTAPAESGAQSISFDNTNAPFLVCRVGHKESSLCLLIWRDRSTGWLAKWPVKKKSRDLACDTAAVEIRTPTKQGSHLMSMDL